MALQRHKRQTLLGIRIGHASDFLGITGCTVVLCEHGALCGVDVRGSAAGTRDLAPCLPEHLVDRVHAIFLSGGSAFGLDAAAGVMDYLESRGVGFPAGAYRVPIVPAAVIFDLHIGSHKARPTPGMALRACKVASDTVAEGSIGAGTGATVGKLFGVARATKAGVGFDTLALAGGVIVQALAVVNAFGDVLDPEDRRIIAGARAAGGSTRTPFVGMAREMFRRRVRHGFGAVNTTLVVIMTNAMLDKLAATKVAQMAQDGMARAISPVHTQFDGDLVFTLALGGKSADLNTVGAAAAEITARAIVRAVRTAKDLGGVRAIAD